MSKMNVYAKILLAVGILGFGTLILLHGNKLKKQVKKKQDDVAEESKNSTAPLIIPQLPKKQDDVAEENKNNTPPLIIPPLPKETKREQSRFLHPDLCKEILLFWHESLAPLKVQTVDIKIIFGQLLSRSINEQFKHILSRTASSSTPIGICFFGGDLYPGNGDKFIVAVKCSSEATGLNEANVNIFDIILTALKNKPLDRDEETYLGKWRATTTIPPVESYSDYYVMFTLQKGDTQRCIWLNVAKPLWRLRQEAKELYEQNLPFLSAKIAHSLDETLPKELADIVLTYAIEAQTKAQIMALY